MDKRRVSIVRTGPQPDREQIERAVRQAVALAGGLEQAIRPGDRVMIKPNLVGMPDAEHPGGITNPLVCRAVADLVRETGARPLIAESSQRGTSTEEVMQATGYAALREQGYEVIDLKRAPVVTLDLPEALLMKRLPVFKPAVEVDAIISVPVLKTHDQLEITLGLKNMKGLVDDRTKRLFHQEGVIEGCVDLCTALPPAFTVVDGIIGQEGMGPLYGLPVEMDLILAGRDPVAVDTVGGKIMGFRPEEVPITVLAARQGLGTMDEQSIEVTGEAVAAVRRRFMRANEDARAQVEGLRLIYDQGACTGCRNAVHSLIFDLHGREAAACLRGATIIVGGNRLPEGVPPEKVVSIGRCCGPEVRRLTRHVKGCPPNNVDVLAALTEIFGVPGR